MSAPDSPASDARPRLFLPVCLVVLAAASAALAFAFYFRGAGGDYDLYRIDRLGAAGNAYAPEDASRTLAFPGLGRFAAAWGAIVGAAWLAVARLLVRRDRLPWRSALGRAAPTAYPLILLLAVPAHYYLGWPLTLGPVFLMIVSIGLCGAVGVYLARPRLESRRARLLFSTWGAAGISLLYAAVFTTLLLRQFYALRVGFPDTGLFAESLFHASRGEALRTHWEASGVAFHAHCFLLLAPLSYLYRLWPAHEFLFVLQSVALGSGGLAVYFLGRRVLADRFASWSLAAAWLLAPTTCFVNIPASYGFRPMALLGPLILWAVVALAYGHEPLFFLLCLLALLAKETAAPIVVMLGVFIALRYRRWVLAAGTCALGVGYYLFATRLAAPYIFGQPYDFTPLLGEFGSSAPEVVGNVLLHPLKFLSHVLGTRLKVFFVFHLMVPLLFLPLLSPSALLVGLGSLCILLMASFFGKRVIYIGAQSPALPGMMLAAVYGLRNIAGLRTALLRQVLPHGVFGNRARVLRALGAGVVVAAACSHVFFFTRTVPWSSFEVTPRARLGRSLRERVPREASVAVTCRLAAHFTEYAELYVAPKNLLLADYVVLDLRDDWVGLAAAASYTEALLRSPDYHAVFAQDHFLVFRRGSGEEPTVPVPRMADAPQMAFALDRPVGDLAVLLGYDAHDTAEGVELTLYWRVLESADGSRAVRLTVAGIEDGRETLFGWRYLPAGGVYPTWRWRPGEVVRDRVVLPGLRLVPGGEPPVRRLSFEPLPHVLCVPFWQDRPWWRLQSPAPPDSEAGARESR